MQLVPEAEAPELDEEASRAFAEGWPEFIFHDQVAKQYNDRRDQYFADWNFYLVDESIPVDADPSRRLLAGCWGVLLAWDGTVADLPGGYTDSLARAITAYEAGIAPNTFVLMAAAVRADQQGRGIAGQLITAVRDHAVAADLPQVIAPLRPTLKARYPLTDIATYVTWTRDDGQPFDPWLRTHTRLGATVLAPAPASQTITGTVEEWQEWTGMPFPSPGTYTIPAGLSTLTITNGIGTYVEPNIWIRHA